MASLNKLTIIGNLGADPEMRYTPNGKAVTNLRVATNRRWPDPNAEGGWAEESIWFTVTTWGDTAERNAEKLKKGDQVYVEGRLKPLRLYTRQDETVGAQFEIDARTVLKLGKSERNGDESYAASAPQDREPRPTDNLDVDDIPF